MALTKSQKEAVFSTNGNILINAGAGSGKTTAFTARVAYLINNEKVDPKSILAITFTNEAADNMRDKLKNLIGARKAKEINVTTFHSLAYKTLKTEYYSEYRNKTIMQQWWKMKQLYDIIKSESALNPIGLDLRDDSTGLRINAGDLAQFISYQKSNMILPNSAVLIDDKVRLQGVLSRSELQAAYDLFCEQCIHANLIEFDDMLMDFYYKLTEDESLRNEFLTRYKYVMVDEMQDTNNVNMEILKLISDNNLYAVGDFRQGIYGFINADIDNILTFTSSFDNVKVIQFRENFRSTETIVNFCNRIIDVSPVELYRQFDGQVAARNVAGDNISIVYHQNDYDEVDSIVNDIANYSDESYDDIAVICRTNAQLGIFELELADRDIPFDISSTHSFFDRSEIADLIAYAEHMVDISNDMALRRIINKPNRFISNKIQSDLDKYAFENNLFLEEAIGQIDAGKSNGKLMDLKILFEDLRDMREMSAGRVLKKIYNEIRYYDHIRTTAKTPSDIVVKEEAIERLFSMAKTFPNIKAFLGHVNKVKINNNKPKKNSVKLMTVHSSKGLEFKRVYGAFVTGESFPHKMNNDYEEERRLFYVLASRAKDELFLSSFVYGSGSNESGGVVEESPFLAETVGGSIISDLRKKALHNRGSYKILLDNNMNIKSN